jgi:hypothetical protein
VDFEGTWKGLAPERIEALAKAFPWPGQRPAIRQPCDCTGPPDEVSRRLLAEALSPGARLVVELGVRLGPTTRFIAERLPDAGVVAIDHWREYLEQRSQPELRIKLPALYETFLALCWPYRERIIPLRMASPRGPQVLADYGLRPDLIYVGGGYSYEAALSDFAFSKRLFPHANLLGDGYSHSPVRDAVDEFAALHGLSVRTRGSSWRFLNRAAGAGPPGPAPAL